jgi:pimeloyl-ACP methyl ester carboxylesterase
MTKNRRKFWTILCLAIIILTIFGSIAWKKWSHRSPPLLPATVTTAGTSQILRGQYYEASIPPTTADSYQSADFRIWIPQDVPTLRGMLVKQHGCGESAAATGLDHANDLQWQALAAKHQLALLGAKFPTGKGTCGDWALINNGSLTAFFKALELVGTQSKHLELSRVPWALWGHSGGADWISQFLQQYPDRTIAAIAARGGAFTLLGTNPTLANTPVLFAIGAKDKVLVNETQTLPTLAFQRYRKLAALWALAVEANTGHETSDTRMLAIPYLDAILTQRLPAQGNDLRPIDPTQGWLGNLVTHQIAPVAKFAGEPLAAAWLPNEETARKWQQYVTKGKIPPTHKPSVPTNLQAIRRDSNTVFLTWKYQPDLETGLPAFRIDRNKSAIATIPNQSHNFGDAPDPPHPVLEFSDNNATLNAIYSIVAVNDLGESKSESISPR